VAARDGARLSARELVATMQRSVMEWTDGAGSNDDATFFVIKAEKK